MTGFDVFVCAILVASALLGWARGLVREVLSLIAYGAAFAAAIWWGPMLYSWLDMIDTAMLRMVLAYGGVFVVVLLAIGLFNMALGALINMTGLGAFNRTLGGFFGLARGLLLVLVLVALAGYTPLPEEHWWREAKFSGTVVKLLIHIRHKLPPELAAWVPYQ